MTRESDVEALFAAAHDTYGSADVAFNNAGISPPDDDSILMTGLGAWRRVQDVNLTSVFLCCKAAIPDMQRQSKGLDRQHRVFRGGDGRGDVADFVQRLQGRRAGDEPRVGCAVRPRGHPGECPVPRAGEHALLQELFAADPERAARRRVHVRFAEPEEIAAAVAFLACDDSSFMTASTFLLDGGISGAYVTPE